MDLDVDIQLERAGFNLDVKCHVKTGATGIFGPSGSGKTTILQAVAGLVQPTRGRIVLGGRTLFDSDRRLDLPPHQRRIGLVFQEPRLFPHLSVARNLTYSGPDLEDSRLRNIVELLDLGSLMERNPRDLSGGEAQRVSLGRVLVTNPESLLLDEPLSSLDRELKARILPYVRRVREALNVPLLYVSHDLDEILELTDEMILLDAGHIVGGGRYLDLIRDPACRRRLQQAGMLNVLPSKVIRCNVESGCMELTLRSENPGPVVFAPLADASAGADANLVIRPEDIAISLSEPEHISVQNRLNGCIRALLCDSDRVLCEIDVGVPLLVEVTPQAVASLGLREGLNVWCLFKARAVRLV